MERNPLDVATIAGVSLELYVSISRASASVGYDAVLTVELASRVGIAPSDWNAAIDGWTALMQSEPTVSRRFNELYVATRPPSPI